MIGADFDGELSTRPLTFEEAESLRDMLASMENADVVLSIADFDRLISRFGREKLRQMILGQAAMVPTARGRGPSAGNSNRRLRI